MHSLRIFLLNSFTLFLLLFCLFSNLSLQAVDVEESIPFELGFWLGSANPFPGSETNKVLDSGLGLGLFGRWQWPKIFYTELGIGYSNYLSKTEKGLTAIPVYGSLAYKLPFDWPVSLFVKGGMGVAYVIARPANLAKWDPMALLGFEVSFVAGKKVRIGLRTDYHRIFETILTSPPPETQRYYLSPVDRDFRLYNPNYYKLKDAEFFYFSLMLSFLI